MLGINLTESLLKFEGGACSCRQNSSVCKLLPCSILTSPRGRRGGGVSSGRRGAAPAAGGPATPSLSHATAAVHLLLPGVESVTVYRLRPLVSCACYSARLALVLPRLLVGSYCRDSSFFCLAPNTASPAPADWPRAATRDCKLPGVMAAPLDKLFGVF